MHLSSLRLVSLAAQQTRASVSSLVLFNLPQPGLPVCDLTISSESKVMKLLMPHSCFQLGVFFSLKRNMSRRMEFSQTESQGDLCTTNPPYSWVLHLGTQPNVDLK